MKHLIIFILLGIFSIIKIQALDIKCDERIELISTICKLADFEEYNMDSARDYIPKFNEWFIPHKDHGAVNMFHRLQSEYGLGFDAPIIIALSLKRNGYDFILDDSIKVDDERLRDLDLKAVADTISMFYKDTSFKDFYNQMMPFYKKHTNDFKDKVVSQINLDWYEKFYGKKNEESFNILIGFLTGGCNYGPAIEKCGEPRNIYAVMGYVMRPDSITAYEAQPEIYRDIIIHEFNHSFVNPLISSESNFRTEMEPVGEKLLSQCSTVMEMQAYPNWDNIINESIVRAAVACYLLDNGSKDDVENSILEEMKVGFYWMPKLVNKLNAYRKNRDLYSDFDSFYLEIISFFEDLTNETDKSIQSLFQ